MSWSLTAKLAELAGSVAENPYTPKDGRIERAVAELVAHIPGTMSVSVTSYGHLNEDGTGNCSVSYTATLPG